MEGWLTGITRAGVESYLSNSAWRGEAQWITTLICRNSWAVAGVEVVLNRERIVEEEDLITIGAEKEEAGQFRPDVVCSKLHRVLALDQREVIAELKLSLDRLLGHIDIGSGLNGGEHNVRIGSDTENCILEILIVERECIQLRRAQGVSVAAQNAVEA